MKKHLFTRYLLGENVEPLNEVSEGGFKLNVATVPLKKAKEYISSCLSYFR